MVAVGTVGFSLAGRTLVALEALALRTGGWQRAEVDLILGAARGFARGVGCEYQGTFCACRGWFQSRFQNGLLRGEKQLFATVANASTKQDEREEINSSSSRCGWKGGYRGDVSATAIR